MKVAKRAVRDPAVMSMLALSVFVITPAQAALQFSSIKATAGGPVKIEWQSLSNAVYRIEYTDAPAPISINWKTFYNNYPSHGTNTLWMDSGDANAVPLIDFPGDRKFRFYRVAQIGTNNPAQAPQITIIAPPNNTTLTGDMMVIVSVAASSNVNHLRLFVDGTEAGSQSANNTNFVVNTSRFANGIHQLFAVVGTSNQNYRVSPFKTVTFNNFITDWRGKFVVTNLTASTTNQYRANFGGCANWVLTITNQFGLPVRTVIGSGKDMKFAWDGTDDSGTLPPNGLYGVGLSALTSLTPCLGDAAHWYVREGAAGAGTGRDWNNAWTDVTNINWALIQPGHTIWIAGGTYGQLDIGTSGTENNRVYIKRPRSTNAAPVTAAGWNVGFDSAPIIHLVACRASEHGNYVTLDGQVPYSGIVVTNTFLDETYAVDLNASSINHFELLNVDIGGVSTTNTILIGDSRCLSANAPLSASGHGLHVAYCKLHGAVTLILTGNQEGMLWEHNFLYDNVVGNTDVWHPNVWNSTGGDTNCVFRYNDISNYMVECFMFSDSPPNVNWQIYGNLIHDATLGQTSRILESQNAAHGPVLLFNNTFVNLYWGIRALTNYYDPLFPEHGIGSWVGCVSTNNVFINAGDPDYFGFFNGADDYLFSDANVTNAAYGTHNVSGASTEIFVDYSNSNYRIVTNLGPLFPRQKGVALPLQFSKDFDGNTHSTNGPWDVGAFKAAEDP